jgi:flagellar biosynthesis protein FliQ
MNKQFLMPLGKKGQGGGLVTGLVFGVASLIIGVIIAFVIVATLSGSGLLNGLSTATYLNTTVDGLTGNFSSGVDKISSKIPTILLIAAIVLIIGVLAVLVGIWQRMRMGGGNL